MFHINRTEVLPLRVMHGRLPILGYRIGGRLGYITDMHMMPEESYEQLKGLDVLVMNALRPKPHPTPQSISEELEAAGADALAETPEALLARLLCFFRSYACKRTAAVIN